MFTAILRFLGIIKPEPVVPVTELARQEMAFEAYLEYLYSLDMAVLYGMRSDAVIANNKVREQFIKRVIKEKDKHAKSKDTKTSRKIVDYPDTEPESTQLLLMAAYTQQFDNASTEKPTVDVASSFSGKDGMFNGGGASGDWERSRHPVNHFINPTPRTYRAGVEDGRRSPIEPETNSGLASLNPVYHAPSSSKSTTTHNDDDPSRSSVLSRSSYTRDPDPVYHNPPPSYSPPSYEPPSHSCSGTSDTSSSSSCDSGGSSPSCD